MFGKLNETTKVVCNISTIVINVVIDTQDVLRKTCTKSRLSCGRRKCRCIREVGRCTDVSLHSRVMFMGLIPCQYAIFV